MIREFDLVNEEKLNRVLKGVIGRLGQLTGGLESQPDWSKKTEEEKEALTLAHYDRTGGLILKGGLKVSTGSFWDIKLNAPRPEPVLKFMTAIEDEIVEVTEEEAKVIETSKAKIDSLKKKKKRARI